MCSDELNILFSLLEEDIEKFYRASKSEDMIVAYCDLKEKYPDNKLINEIEVTLQKIKIRKNYSGIPEKNKIFKELCEEYDYDDEIQFEILNLVFNDKYVHKEIIEEYEISK